jgi:hypothetical protein
MPPSDTPAQFCKQNLQTISKNSLYIDSIFTPPVAKYPVSVVIKRVIGNPKGHFVVKLIVIR